MATELETIQHEWVAISIQPIHVVQDPITEELVFIGDPDEPGGTQYGCDVCSTPLEGNFNTRCAGEELDI